jgi:hypothetical protein
MRNVIATDWGLIAVGHHSRRLVRHGPPLHRRRVTSP